MLKSLKKIFLNENLNLKKDIINEDLYLLCGLMVEASQTDDKVDLSEIEEIKNSLINVYKEDPLEVENVLKKCLEEKDEPKSLHYFTSKLNKSFSNDKKNLLIETLWTIILADGKIHSFESNLIRRLAGLLFISDVSCGNAKKRAIEKMNKKN